MSIPITAIARMLAVLSCVVACAQMVNEWIESSSIPVSASDVIRSQDDLDAFRAKHEKGGHHPFVEGDPIEIPTGVYLQSVSFLNATDVNATGYIWQHYPVNFQYNKGIVFPEQVSSDDGVLMKVFEDKSEIDGKPRDLVGWYFDIVVRQSFDYRRYPFDPATIWLRLWPAEFGDDQHVFLTPDFRSYTSMGPGETFGLDSDLVPGGWEVSENFFNYRSVGYDASFGFKDAKATGPRTRYFELFYNLHVKRKFINAMIINLIPLAVVALLLFGAVMITSTDKARAERFGFDASGVLGTCSALFFVVILSHIQVRSEFKGSGLVYIEYFYLILYAYLILVALNAWVLSNTPEYSGSLLVWRDNFIVKLLYWPVLLWAMLIVTWILL